mgnify:CR=1 FL=1
MVVKFLLLFLLINSIFFVVVGVGIILYCESKPRPVPRQNIYEENMQEYDDDFEWEDWTEGNA